MLALHHFVRTSSDFINYAVNNVNRKRPNLQAKVFQENLFAGGSCWLYVSIKYSYQ